MNNVYITAKEALPLVSHVMGYHTLLRMFKAEHIPARKVGKKWLVPREELLAFVADMLSDHPRTYKDRYGKVILIVR
jgi:excisionase family DNA binding protein